MKVSCGKILLIITVFCLVIYQLSEVKAENVNSTEQRPDSAKNTLTLNLSQFIHLVSQKNEQILARETEWLIYQQRENGARSIFEPELIGTYQIDGIDRQNTVEETVSQNFATTYTARNNDANVAFQGLVPTGAQLSLGYTSRKSTNSLTENYTDHDTEYKQFTEASISQPLLKNAGVKVTTAHIRVAEGDTERSFQMFRQEMMQVVFRAAATYWDLILAQMKFENRHDSVRDAEQLLAYSRERYRTGKMAETEVLESEAGVALRKALTSVAEQLLFSTKNEALNMILSSTMTDEMNIEGGDDLTMQKIVPDVKSSLEKAFQLRPEYLAALVKIERENIRLEFAKNQRWPQLDLKASYGANGLAFTRNDAWDTLRDRDYPSWSVGVEFRIPLFGGRKSRSELTAVKLEKERALRELKSIEVTLVNEVDTVIHNIYSIIDQVKYASQVADFRKRLLDVEVVRLEAGKSNTRLVLEKEEDYREAKEAELESLVNFRKAVHAFELAEGTLLARYGIEQFEVKM